MSNFSMRMCWRPTLCLWGMVLFGLLTYASVQGNREMRQVSRRRGGDRVSRLDPCCVCSTLSSVQFIFKGGRMNRVPERIDCAYALTTRADQSLTSGFPHNNRGKGLVVGTHCALNCALDFLALRADKIRTFLADGQRGFCFRTGRPPNAPCCLGSLHSKIGNYTAFPDNGCAWLI